MSGWDNVCAYFWGAAALADFFCASQGGKGAGWGLATEAYRDGPRPSAKRRGGRTVTGAILILQIGDEVSWLFQLGSSVCSPGGRSENLD